MKLVSFLRQDESPGIGVVIDTRCVLDLSRVGADVPSDMTAFLEAAEPALEAATAAHQCPNRYPGAVLEHGTYTLLPVIPQPRKFFLVGLNYKSHADELGVGIPKWPSIFGRFAHTLVAHGEPIRIPKSSQAVDWEGELAVVIGRPGKYIREADAFDHVAGYTCFNDVSIRDYQERLPRITLAKNFDASGSLGPWLITRDEVPHPDRLELTTTVNGKVKQRGNTADFIFSIPYLLALISSACRLEPGDVIATGTPGGVGWAAKPPTYLKQGDTVTVSIAGVGELTNPVLGEE